MARRKLRIYIDTNLIISLFRDKKKLKERVRFLLNLLSNNDSVELNIDEGQLETFRNVLGPEVNDFYTYDKETRRLHFDILDGIDIAVLKKDKGFEWVRGKWTAKIFGDKEDARRIFQAQVCDVLITSDEDLIFSRDWAPSNLANASARGTKFSHPVVLHTFNALSIEWERVIDLLNQTEWPTPEQMWSHYTSERFFAEFAYEGSAFHNLFDLRYGELTSRYITSRLYNIFGDQYQDPLLAQAIILISENEHSIQSLRELMIEKNRRNHPSHKLTARINLLVNLLARAELIQDYYSNKIDWDSDDWVRAAKAAFDRSLISEGYAVSPTHNQRLDYETNLRRS